MKSLSERRFLPASILAAAALVALAAPGAASATGTKAVPCSGTNIEAQGSSLQHIAQELLEVEIQQIAQHIRVQREPGIGRETNGPVITDRQRCRTEGLRSRRCHSNYKENGFVGTDEAPNATQKSEIEGHATGAEERSVETIPVLQAAVAVIVHLPKAVKPRARRPRVVWCSRTPRSRVFIAERSTNGAKSKKKAINSRRKAAKRAMRLKESLVLFAATTRARRISSRAI